MAFRAPIFSSIAALGLALWPVVDTSHGAPLTLISGAPPKPVFVPSHFAPYSHSPAEWLAPDTSKSSAKVLFGDQIPPRIPAPHFAPHPASIEQWLNPDTSYGLTDVRRPDQIPPRIPAPNFGPQQKGLENWLNPDTTAETPKTLKAEVRLPPGDTPHFAQSIQYTYWVSPDTTQDMPSTLRAPPSPFTPSPHYPPPRFWWQPPDSSAGTPELVRPDQTTPFAVLQQPALDFVRPVYDTSRGTFVGFFPVAIPPPSPFVGAPQFVWQGADTGRGTLPGLFPLPIPQQTPLFAAPQWVWNVTDSSQSAYGNFYPFVQVPLPPGSQVPPIGPLWAWEPPDTTWESSMGALQNVQPAPPAPPAQIISGGAYPDEREGKRRSAKEKAPTSFEAAEPGDYLPPDQFAKQYAAARDRQIPKQKAAIESDDDAYLHAFLFMMLQDEDDEA